MPQIFGGSLSSSLDKIRAHIRQGVCDFHSSFSWHYLTESFLQVNCFPAPKASGSCQALPKSLRQVQLHQELGLCQSIDGVFTKIGG
jgi:hypothetical protein